MASDREDFNPACEVFQKHSADLLTVIQDPEVLAWELYAENIISPKVRDAASFMMYERGARTSNLLAAVESRIAVDPRAFDVFLSVLAKRPSMGDFCARMKNTRGKPASGGGCCLMHKKCKNQSMVCNVREKALQLVVES